MLLNISKNILHISVIRIVICAASVSMWCSWKLHVHQWLVAKILRFLIELWRMMWSTIRHQITVAQTLLIAVLLHLLLVGYIVADLVELGANLSICISAIHLSSKDMSTLSSSTRLSVCHDVSVWSSLLDLSDHLQLVWVIDDELSWLLTFVISSSWYDLALRCNRRNLVVIFLYRR